jgi:hypothetical protein
MTYQAKKIRTIAKNKDGLGTVFANLVRVLGKSRGISSILGIAGILVIICTNISKAITTLPT